MATDGFRTQAELMRQGEGCIFRAFCKLVDDYSTWFFEVDIAAWLPPGRIAPAVLEEVSRIVDKELGTINGKFDFKTASVYRLALVRKEPRSEDGEEEEQVLYEGKTDTRREYAEGQETARVFPGQIPIWEVRLPSVWPYEEMNYGPGRTGNSPEKGDTRNGTPNPTPTCETSERAAGDLRLQGAFRSLA